MLRKIIDGCEHLTYSVSIPSDMLPRLNLLCEHLGMSISDYFRFSLIYSIDLDYEYLIDPDYKPLG